MRRTQALSLVSTLVLVWASGRGVALGQDAQSSGFRVLSGEEAASFAIPADMELVRSIRLPVYGLTYERYQQYYGLPRASVWNGQITVYRDDFGTITTVTGSHYPRITPANAVGIAAATARSAVDRDLGPGGEKLVELMVHPDTGRYFFRVETRRFASRWIHWIDAGNGGLIKKYDALMTDDGTGVKGDTKSMDGLTTFHGSSGHGAGGSHWDLFSTDNRQLTYDARNGSVFLYYTIDDDNHWNLVTSDRTSPGQPALVDAQSHANAADDYFLNRHGFDWLDCGYGAMESAPHFSLDYNNAFWDGRFVIFGDGDGSIFQELSGALDVTAHEYAHGITDCTSNLVYQDESGALNEAFSDMLGTGTEYFVNESTSTNCVLASGQSDCADWWIGEDVYLPADTVPGFRNMKDPAEDGDPDHYSERQVGGNDNGGVHTNSAIPNHAFYLLANGGQNAGCGASSSPHTHTADCDVTVGGIGLADAERIFFLGFTGLSSNATMSQARDATLAVAKAQYPAACPAVSDAWEAVGVSGTEVCVSSSNTAPTANDDAAGTNEDNAITVTLTASDPEECELAFGIVSGPSHGSLSGITDAGCAAGAPNTDSATVTYTPAADYAGSDSFTYIASDGSASSDTATVSITVDPVNDAPVANDHSVTTEQDTAVAVSLTASDVDDCELTFTIVSAPSNGALDSLTDAVCSSGRPNTDAASVTYTPSSGFNGSDSITYRVNDGSVDSDLATVSITVSEVGQAETVHVGDLDGSASNAGRTWTAYVLLAVHDQNENPVPGATVTGAWTVGVPNSMSCTTDASGHCTVSASEIPKRDHETVFTVLGISDSLTYVGGDNHDVDGDSTGTAIVVSR